MVASPGFEPTEPRVERKDPICEGFSVFDEEETFPLPAAALSSRIGT
jgi:hypothetical protein